MRKRIPSLKTIRTNLTWLDKTKVGKDLGARLVRQLMEYQVTGVMKPSLEKYIKQQAANNNTGFVVSKGSMYTILRCMDKILDTCGVEYLNSRNRDRPGIEYCNTDDPYAATVMYDWESKAWRIASWGDVVESNPSRFGE